MIADCCPANDLGRLVQACRHLHVHLNPRLYKLHAMKRIPELAYRVEEDAGHSRAETRCFLCPHFRYSLCAAPLAEMIMSKYLFSVLL
jgi:hypothetical protein